jgi:hypothetical protein
MIAISDCSEQRTVEEFSLSRQARLAYGSIFLNGATVETFLFGSFNISIP